MRNLFILAALSAVIFSCNTNQQQPNSKTSETLDTRPKSQLLFNKTVDSIKNDFSIQENVAKADQTIERFNKYALDSLKNIKDWEVIVNAVSDNTYDASSFARHLLDLDKPFYNLKMYSVIRMYDKINPKLDSLNLPQGEVIFITYSTLKDLEKSKKIVNLIKTINVGDTLLISGAITHIDDNLKPNFSDVIKSTPADWNVDLLATDVKKKH